MKLFYTALMTKFNVSNNFKTAIGGRLFQGEAPEGTIYPYAIFKLINNNQDDDFKNKADDIIIQFSIYSEKASSVEVNDAMTYLKTLFDDCILTVSGSTHICFYRLNDGPLLREEVGTQSAAQVVWHYPVDYRVVLERS